MRSSRMKGARSAGSRSRVPRGARKVGIVPRSLAAGLGPGPWSGRMIRRVGPSGASVHVLAGYLAEIALGTMLVTLLFLGRRAVMDVRGACADGRPYVSAQPCPTGIPLAMVGGMFGLFGASGPIVWFGSRIGRWAATIVALGWPALFLALGFNFLDDSFRPPDVEPTPVWGWLIPGALFWAIGAAPVAVGIAAWREVRAGGTGNRWSQQVRGGPRPPSVVYRVASAVADGPVAPPQAPESADPAELLEEQAGGRLLSDRLWRSLPLLAVAAGLVGIWLGAMLFSSIT